MQVQIQALLAAGGGGTGGEERRITGPKVEVATPAIFNGETEREITGSNMGPQVEMAKPAIFNGESGKVGGFVTACRLYLKMKMREAMVEEQVFWILSHVQGGLADVWKENVMEELEVEEMEYETVEKFLTVLKKKFGGREEETVKVEKLRKLEQGEKTMEEFIQEFKRAVRGSGYEGRPLVEEFKREINRRIRKKLMKVENLPAFIKQ